MNQFKIFVSTFLITLIVISCNLSNMQQTEMVFEKGISVAQLAKNDQTGLNIIRDDFVKNNVGYDLHYIFNQKKVKAKNNNRILFIQTGGGTATLKVGDLVYIPRGIMHRGIGGVLAQVITVSGFVPGSEIGVDHYLKTINDQLQLTGENALPYNESASSSAIIK